MLYQNYSAINPLDKNVDTLRKWICCSWRLRILKLIQ